MPTFPLICTTRENRHSALSPQKPPPFWREQGVIVGVVLRPECALALAELAAACQEHTSATDFSSDSFTTRRNLAGLGFGHMARMGIVVIAGDRGRG